MKATEQYFSVMLFIILYKVVLTFESVDEVLKCDHSKESYWAVLSCCTVYYAVQGGSNFESVALVLFTVSYKVVLTLSVDEIQKCDHSKESSRH